MNRKSMKYGMALAAAALVLGGTTVKAESLTEKVAQVVETEVAEFAGQLKAAVETAAKPESLGVRYTTGNLTLRAQATKESDKLAVVPINVEVPVYDMSQEYFQVEYKGQMGFVLGEYLTEDKAEAEKAEQVAIEQEKKKAASSKKKSSSGGSKKSSGGSSKKSGGTTKKNDAECVTGGLLN